MINWLPLYDILAHWAELGLVGHDLLSISTAIVYLY